MNNMLIDRFEASLLTTLALLPMVELDYDDSGLRHVDIHMGDWCKAVRVNGIPVLYSDGNGGFTPSPADSLGASCSDTKAALDAYDRYENSGKTPSDLHMLMDSTLAAARLPRRRSDTDDLAARQLLNTAAAYVNGGYLNSWHIRLDFWDKPTNETIVNHPRKRG